MIKEGRTTRLLLRLFPFVPIAVPPFFTTGCALNADITVESRPLRRPLPNRLRFAEIFSENQKDFIFVLKTG